MRFGFSTLGCPTWDSRRVADEAARLGFDGVELRLLDGRSIDPIADAAAVKGAVLTCRDRGVDVFALASRDGFERQDPVGHGHDLDSLRRWIDLAATSAVPVVRFFGLVPRGLEDDQADDWLVDSLSDLVQDARRSGVILGLETHQPRYDTARAAADVVRRVDSDAVQIVWDGQNTHTSGESTDDVLAALADRIAYVQLKDASRGPDGVWTPALPGRGSIPFLEQLAALQARSYDRYISLEWEKYWFPSAADPEEAFPRFLAAFRGQVDGT